MRLFERFLVASIATALVTGGAPASEARLDEQPPVYEMKLVYLFDGAETEFVFVIGNSGFRTVSSLESFLVSRPAGTILRWNPGCVRLGGEPLLSSEIEMDEFKAFCRDHQIDLVLMPSG
jgi:hypothetical protein